MSRLRPKKRQGPVAAREKNRERPMVTYTLSTEAIDALTELAEQRGMSKSALVEYLVREEAFRQRVEVGRTRRKR